MTQLQPLSTGKQRHSGASLKIDMTPLVDLGFLLITFFIFTTTMVEPFKTDLYMPKDGVGGNIGESNAITILLAGNDSVYYYHGKWKEAIEADQVHVTNYNIALGIGSIIRKKQKQMGTRRNELMLMLKPAETSSYSNLMNALDETVINQVKKYAIMDITTAEKDFIASRR